jgi:hypothetical protein
MSDPTPTTQAVYAALAWIRDDHSAEQLALIHDYPTAKMGATFNALCILAAEVERLRARIAELENRNGKLNRSQVDMKNDLFRLRAETHAIRNQNADDSLTLATLYDMVLGDDWGDNSNKELIRAVGLLQRNATAEVERLRAVITRIDEVTDFDYGSMPETLRAEAHTIVRELLNEALELNPTTKESLLVQPENP